MTSRIASELIEMALQKQDTEHYANLTLWDKQSALNKAASDWMRRQIWGTNQHKEQNEQSTMVTDDLQSFLVERKLSVGNYEFYADTVKKPENFLYYNNLFVYCSKGECNNIMIPSTLIESANSDDYLSDWAFSPSFDFEQCFHIFINDKFRIFHGGDFKVNSVKLFYYRKPQEISMEPLDADVVWEWKEDVANLIIDEAIKNLAAHIEHVTAHQTSKENTINNN